MGRGGTVFLDEVGDLDTAAQAKILRVLQDKTIERVGGRETIKVDVRLVAATNHDLPGDIARGTFRRDLFHRLNTVTLAVPPLRDRREDIPTLVEHFLDGLSVRMSAEAMQLLMRHDFPGNVRELEHIVERSRLFAEGSVIRREDLPADVARDRGPASPGPSEDRAPPRNAVAPVHDAKALFDRIVSGGESFWDVIQQPFLTRDLSRDEARRFVASAYQQVGGSYKQMARVFRIETQYKKMVHFLWDHDLGARP